MPPKGYRKQTTKQQDLDKLCEKTPLPPEPKKELPEIPSAVIVPVSEEEKTAVLGLTIQQERFVYEYMKDWDRVEALRRAGYRVENLNTAGVQAVRILRMPAAMELIDNIQCAILATNLIDANWAIVRFKLTYMKALNDRDYGNALRALENISKFLGLYEKHNKQKRYTQDDVDELKTELEQAGFNFSITAVERGLIDKNEKKGLPAREYTKEELESVEIPERPISSDRVIEVRASDVTLNKFHTKSNTTSPPNINGDSKGSPGS